MYTRSRTRVNACGCVDRKQSWLWLQGDLHRSRTKGRIGIRDKADYTQIVGRVDDLRIDDILDNKAFEDRITYQNDPQVKHSSYYFKYTYLLSLKKN